MPDAERPNPFGLTRLRCYGCGELLASCRCLDRALQRMWHRESAGGVGVQGSHECPGGCGAEVPSERLACKGCWFRLPMAFRRAVNSAYRHGGRGSREHRAALAVALRWYRDNPREEAVADG